MNEIVIIFKHKNKEYTKTYVAGVNTVIPNIIKHACMENLWDEIVSIKKGKYNPKVNMVLM